MEHKQNKHAEGSIKIRLDSEKGLWDLVLAGPAIYLGKGIFEVSACILQVLDQKGIAYKRIDKTSVR